MPWRISTWCSLDPRLEPACILRGHAPVRHASKTRRAVEGVRSPEQCEPLFHNSGVNHELVRRERVNTLRASFSKVRLKRVVAKLSSRLATGAQRAVARPFVICFAVFVTFHTGPASKKWHPRGTQPAAGAKQGSNAGAPGISGAPLFAF